MISRGRPRGSIISGWRNLLMIQLERLTPRSLVTRAAGRMMRGQFDK